MRAASGGGVIKAVLLDQVKLSKVFKTSMLDG